MKSSHPSWWWWGERRYYNNSPPSPSAEDGKHCGRRRLRKFMFSSAGQKPQVLDSEVWSLQITQNSNQQRGDFPRSEIMLWLTVCVCALQSVSEQLGDFSQVTKPVCASLLVWRMEGTVIPIMKLYKDLKEQYKPSTKMCPWCTDRDNDSNYGYNKWWCIINWKTCHWDNMHNGRSDDEVSFISQKSRDV